MKFQYKISDFLGWTKEEITDSLNKLGKEGWELFKTNATHANWILRRRIEP